MRSLLYSFICCLRVLLYWFCLLLHSFLVFFAQLFNVIRYVCTCYTKLFSNKKIYFCVVV